jgi:hypothetical protein
LRAPDTEKMIVIAKAMGFPPEGWFEDAPGDGALAALPQSQGLVGRVRHHFGVVRYPRTGVPYTSAEIARMSAGVLAEREVEGIRTGAIPDPTVGQVKAQAAFFVFEWQQTRYENRSALQER